MFLQVSPHAKQRFLTRLDYVAPNKVIKPKGYIVHKVKHRTSGNQVCWVLTMFRGQPAVYICDFVDRVLLTVVTDGEYLDMAMKRLKENLCKKYHNNGLIN